ncbi:uncharacterized protein LOC105775461 [Gossypium raimondii]|uniref:uncharacterized protein LOC105775461 n=1 Tax=Gossypium raimondii TaxID=29730 RepID=UPI00063A9584|nr:uncharacterized protein LOC105775461 [Gossypium raimondii]
MYVDVSYVDARRKEFLSLTQGSKTVAEYEAEFLRLSCYDRGIVAIEYERCVRFEDGLRDELRVLIAPQRERDFATLVEKAKIAEDVKRSERQNREKDRGRFKRDSEPSSSFERPKKKARFDGPPVRGGQQPPKGHGQVRGGNGVGRGHGKFGRGVGNSEARQPAVVYASRRQEDGDAPDVITGTFLIHNVPYTTLIDIGSTHSYIACTMSGTLGIMCESTANEMTMLSPLGQSVRVDKLFIFVPLEVQGVIFLADLMELPFGEFNLILGMDWLVKHRAILDCATKCMVLKTTEDEEVAVIREGRDVRIVNELPGLNLELSSCQERLQCPSPLIG